MVGPIDGDLGPNRVGKIRGMGWRDRDGRKVKY